ncbi:hypothetical protein [Nocardioides lianchengensis]|uniref:Uncharacterized protein n=1 Tax=Nocardioides lianchengensis TaxID=1045774 RepID=A0A1G6LU96_9ACTN|nr:hypothetical protein [Nocardioides lianchengensis]NYG12445.1 hypothetical protein [Nocardioides lianchengensis]SDC46687.1 hypothetical protein SAMN05421872_102359 [Nocardioides lianchengensis]
MANETGKRLLELTVEYIDAKDRDSYGPRIGDRRSDERTVDQIAEEYENVISSMFGPRIK